MQNVSNLESYDTQALKLLLKKAISDKQEATQKDFLKFTDVVRGRTTKSHTWFAMVIMEGKNRAVRKLWNSLGFEVSRLKRTRLGHIFLPADLSPGKYRDLEDKEINDFF